MASAFCSQAVSKPTLCKYTWEFLHAPEIAHNFLKFPQKILSNPIQDCLPFAARRALVSIEAFLVKMPQNVYIIFLFSGIFSFYFVGAVAIENEPDRLPSFIGENLRKFENSIK